LAAAQKHLEELKQISAELDAANAARKKDGIKTPAQIPKADTDSTVMPNKEGGYAPNYTPTVATDGAADFIVDCEVIPGPNEHNELLPSVDRIKENFGQTIDSVSADKAFGTGPNLQGMETRNVNFHTPVESPAPQEGNPAKREDPRQPVPEVGQVLLRVRRGDQHVFLPDGQGDALSEDEEGEGSARREGHPSLRLQGLRQLPAGPGVPRPDCQTRANDQSRRA
jgi:hypothetical protein